MLEERTLSQDRLDPLGSALLEAIDAEFYAFAYGGLPSEDTAASHYVSLGWREGRDPNPWFSTRAYLERNPDVAAAGLVPLFHFLATGAGEGRATVSSAHADAYYDRPPTPWAGRGEERFVPPSGDRGPAKARAADDELYERQVVHAEFDADFYLTVNPDVAAAGVDPLTHFLGNGWHEGRDPNAYFSVRRYLEANVDVAEAGVNPFFHNLAVGKSEGRPLRLEVGFRYEVLAALETVERRMAAVRAAHTEEIGASGELRIAFDSLRRSARRRLYVSVSHDDFTANIGGLQFCLSREAVALERMGIDHVHLFPDRPLLVTNYEEDDPVLGVLVNGVLAGYFKASTVAVSLGETLEGAWPERNFSVHSCLGHNVEKLVLILRQLHQSRGYFWIHDFASACAGYSLLRNDVEFCGGPPPESPACSLCVYGERRPAQVADHARLFAEFDLAVVAPSQSAMDIWDSTVSFRASRKIVYPHCEFRTRPSEAKNRGQGARLRTAFLGYPNAHKGWPIFRELVRRFGRDGRYEFHHLGMSPEIGLPAEFEKVSVTAEDPSAMIAAVETRAIDVAIIWSIWPETFCFTAHEAMAGGAAIVAPPSSGNVAALVRATGDGLVVADEEELYGLYSTGQIAQLGRANRGAELYSLQYTNMTADFLEGGRP